MVFLRGKEVREARSYRSFCSISEFHCFLLGCYEAECHDGKDVRKDCKQSWCVIVARSRENWGFIIVHISQYVPVIYFLQPRLTSYCSHLPKIPSNYGFMSKSIAYIETLMMQSFLQMFCLRGQYFRSK